ncbi:UPF0104 family protein [Methanobrevibacter sp. DSM 116169]|uniref:UPF0104 family protein n=1 Tax=Methanobrevibacter sp. DSM 116169 TaxID=3242727 RepID=UPI0038FD3C3C
MKYKSIIFLAIGLAIMAIMLWFIGIDQVISSLRLANMWFILLAILVQIFTYYLYALRWKIINKIDNINLGIKGLLPMVLVGLAVNNITPSGRGGGEPVKAYILSKKVNKPMEKTLAGVVSDKLLDTFPFVVLAIITIIAVTLYFPLPSWMIAAMIVAVLLVMLVLFILMYMSFNDKFGNSIKEWIIRLVRRFYKKCTSKTEDKVCEVIEGFQDTMKLMFSHKNILFQALPLSFIIWIIEILRVYIVFLAFGVSVSPFLIGEIFIVASLIGMIPLLPGGLGAIDGVMILFYSSAGISPGISAAATVIERLISFWMATVLGFIILPYYGSSALKKVSSIADDDEDSVDDIEDEFSYISKKDK